MSNSTQLAVDQVNNNGGIDGRQLELIEKDNNSDPTTMIEKTRELINSEDVDIMVGPYVSTNRNAAAPILVENNMPLLYPTYYEGGVCREIEGISGLSGEMNIPKNVLEWIFFTGAVPKQQIRPFVPWLMNSLDAQKFFLISNDYLWGRTNSTVTRNFIEEAGGEIVSEDYVPFGFSDWGNKLQTMRDANVDVVYFSTDGDSLISLLKDSSEFGIRDDSIWAGNIMTEQQAYAVGDAADGVYTCGPYFNSLDNEATKNYVNSYTEQFGTDSTTDFVSEPAFWQIKMLAQALRENNPEATSGEEIKEALEYDFSVEAPQGTVKSDPGTHHFSLYSRVGQYNASSRSFDIVKNFGRISPSGVTVQENCLNT